MHANALTGCQRLIEEQGVILVDLNTMLDDCYSKGLRHRPTNAMRVVLEKLEIRSRRIIDGKRRQIRWVLKMNKERDEDEAWKTYDNLMMFGLPITGQRR
jgi:hypothetical protein